MRRNGWGWSPSWPRIALARAKELAGEIAGKEPDGGARGESFGRSRGKSGASEAEILLEESRVQASLIGKPEQMEVVMANMQKRAPKF